jgi:tetratricopeptide (TPR) repeat protein
MFMTPRDLDEVRTLCASKRYDEALKLCAEFIADQPDHPHGYHMRAVVRVVMGEPHLALADRDKVVSLCPQEAGAFMARADDHLRVGNFAAAADDLDRAEKLDNAHYWPLIPFLRALCRARIGRIDEALADAAKVPDDYLLPGFGSDFPSSKTQLTAAIEDARLQRESEQPSDAGPAA